MFFSFNVFDKLSRRSSGLTRLEGDIIVDFNTAGDGAPDVADALVNLFMTT